MDVLTKKQRSYCMSQIRGKQTQPEKIVRTIIRNLGLKYRLNSKLPSKPDLVIQGKKTIVFIDGCFWHGCKKHFKIPTTNQKYWKNKIKANTLRDSKNRRVLKTRGYKVIRIWEHETKDVCRLTERLYDIFNNE